MESVTISASLRFKPEIRQSIARLRAIGMDASFPNLDSGLSKEALTLNVMQGLERDHFKAIERSDGLYVICPSGYVGTLVSVEVGYSAALDKRIIFSEEPEDLGLQALAAGYIGLDEVERLKEFDSI